MSEPIRKVVRARCSPARAFSTFADAIDAWWPPSHRGFAQSHLHVEGRVGGRLVERSTDGQERLLGEVLVWSPHSHFAYTWHLGVDVGATRVDVRFAAEGDLTRVEVVHSEGSSGLGEQWPTRAQRFSRAWEQVLPHYLDAAQAEESNR